jgi:hypothetical protein
MEVSSQVHAPAALSPESSHRYPFYIGDLMDPRAFVDVMEKRKLSYLCLESNPVSCRPARSLVAIPTEIRQIVNRNCVDNRKMKVSCRFLGTTPDFTSKDWARPLNISGVIKNAHQDLNKYLKVPLYSHCSYWTSHRESFRRVFTVSGQVSGRIWPDVSTPQKGFMSTLFLCLIT